MNIFKQSVTYQINRYRQVKFYITLHFSLRLTGKGGALELEGGGLEAGELEEDVVGDMCLLGGGFGGEDRRASADFWILRLYCSKMTRKI